MLHIFQSEDDESYKLFNHHHRPMNPVRVSDLELSSEDDDASSGVSSSGMDELNIPPGSIFS